MAAVALGPLDDTAPYEIRRPATPAPLIFASPHSGRLYPEAMMAASALDADQIRRSEDAHVDALIEDGLAAGATLLLARYARAFVDVNRGAWELDPAMFEDELPDYARSGSARAAAGLGAIARIVGEGQEIYRRKLTFAEAQARIESVHAPWHAALESLIGETLERCGRAVVVDWHSMPSAAARTGQGARCDFVLGDRFGAACDIALTKAADDALRSRGYRVARNNPYAGGYTTEHYGDPARRVHVLQVEISRDLYMDEATLDRTAGFAVLKRHLAGVFRAIAAAL